MFNCPDCVDSKISEPLAGPEMSLNPLLMSLLETSLLLPVVCLVSPIDSYRTISKVGHSDVSVTRSLIPPRSQVTLSLTRPFVSSSPPLSLSVILPVWHVENLSDSDRTWVSRTGWGGVGWGGVGWGGVLYERTIPYCAPPICHGEVGGWGLTRGNA